MRHALLQRLDPQRLLDHQRCQQAAGQQARSPGVEAEEDFVEMLALTHPEQAPQRAQHPQQQDGPPQLSGLGLAQQQHQQRRPDQVEMLLDGQRPHVQQRLGTVEESDAVIGKVQRRDQRVLVDVVEIRPEQRRDQAIGGKKQQQRRHQPEEAPPVETPVIEAFVALELLQQQGGDQESAEDKEKIDAQERALEHRHMCMG